MAPPLTDIPVPRAVRIAALVLLVALSAGVAYLLSSNDLGAAAYVSMVQTDSEDRPIPSNFAKARGDFFFLRPDWPLVPRAARHYRNAVLLTPTSSLHWRDLAAANQRLGRTDAARKAFEAAEFLAPTDQDVQMEFGNFHLAEGNPEEAVRHHRRALEAMPSLGAGIYPVYWAIGWTPGRVARELLPGDPALVRRYWAESLAWLDAADAIALWGDLTKAHADAFDAGSYGRYFDFLVAKREYAEAKRLWSEITLRFYGRAPDGGNELFWNGRFRYERAFAGGLEWRFAERPPADTTVRVATTPGDSRERSLLIRFGGKENTDFSHVRHSFFVEPGVTYRLAYNVRAREITTDNGPYVRITLHGEKPVVTKGKVATGTGDWTFHEEFTAPATAQWAEVAICRDRSAKLNNRIQGEVWFGDFTLEPVAATTVAEEAAP